MRDFYSTLVRRRQRAARKKRLERYRRRGLVPEQLEDRRLLATNVWQSTTSGNWSDPANWSDGVPTPDDDVIIDASGSPYDVTVDVDPDIASLTLNSVDATLGITFRTVTVNGDIDILSGKLNLFRSVIAGTGTLTSNGELTVRNFNNSIAHDVVQNGVLTVRSDSADGVITLLGSLTNHGTTTLENTSATARTTRLTVNAGIANESTGVINVTDDPGEKVITANVVNDGTINLHDRTTFDRTGSVITNTNAMNVSSTGEFRLDATGVFNQDAGSLSANGAFELIFGETFNFNGGVISGSEPIRLFGSSLHIDPSASGAATFDIRSTNNTLSGTAASTHTLHINANGNAGGSATAPNGFTNHGTIVLDNIGTSGAGQAYLNVTSGVLTNESTGVVTLASGIGGRRLDAHVLNHGVVNLDDDDSSLEKPSAPFDNHGLVNIPAGANVSFGTDGVFTQTAGSLMVDGGFAMFVDTFNFDGGVVTGGSPVSLAASGLNIGPGSTGAAEFEFTSWTNTLTGDVAEDQTLRVNASQTSQAILVAASGFTNQGTIVLDNVGAAGSSLARLEVTTGILTNASSGVITLENGPGPRQLHANVMNLGVINLDDDATELEKQDAVFENHATVTAPAAANVTFGVDSVFTQAAGSLTLDGSLTKFGDTFNYDGGTISGAGYVTLSSSALNIGPGSTGAAKFKFDGTGSTLSGDVAENQTLLIQANVNNSATVTAASGFENHGAVVLENIGATGAGTARLDVTAGALINEPTGTIDFNDGPGVRALSADVVNNGTITVAAETELTKAPGLFTNNAELHVTATGSVAFDGDITFTQAAGVLLIDGTFGGGFSDVFNFDGGEILGNTPEFTHTTLNISSIAPFTFLFHSGGNFVNGNIGPAQTIIYERRPGPFAHFLEFSGTHNFGTIRINTLDNAFSSTFTATGPSFTNLGTFEATGLVLLDVASGVFQNAPGGTLSFSDLDGHTLSATLDNEGLVTIAGDSDLGEPGAQHVSEGTIQIDDAFVELIGTSFTNESTGNLNATGTIFTSFTSFTNDGTLAPGHSPGALTLFGDLVQGPTGRIDSEIGGLAAGSEYDFLNVTGQATLDGTLDLGVINGFAPVAGDAFQLLTYGSVVGQFATVEGSVVDDTTAFSVMQSAADIVATATIDPSDLVVTSIAVPPTANTGEPITFSYTVSNISNPTSLDWFDSIFYSEDDHFSALEDVLIERRPHTGGLGTGASYTENVTAILPAAGLGPGHLIVIPDSTNDVPEFNPNNQSASPPFNVQVQELVFEAPMSGALVADQSKFYVVNAPTGEDVRISVQADQPGAAELLVSYQEVPTRSEYDHRSFNFSDSDRAITINAPQAGQYYVQLFGQAATNYSINAEQLGFEVDAVSPTSGSNAGEVTVTVNGAAFRPDNVVKLANGFDRPANSVQFIDANTLSATFDLTGLLTGPVDVVVEDVVTGETAMLNGGFQVTSGNPGHLETRLTVPDAVRIGRTGTVTVDYSNPGETDLRAPILLLSATNAELRLKEHTDADFSSVVRVLATNPNGQPSLLPPGFSGQIAFDIRPIGPTSQSYEVALSETDPDAVINWNVLQDDLRPDYVPQDAWNNVVFPNFISEVGSTGADLQRSLAANADHLATVGTRTQDVERLLTFIVQQSNAFGEISDRWRLGALGRGVPDPTEYSATIDADGDAVIRIRGLTRFFRAQPDGSFVPLAGDFATLTRSGGAFRLQQSDGLIVQFRANGTLEYYEDTHGNRITAAYTSGRLSTLTDDFNNTTTFSYFPSGRLSQIIESPGHTTSFTYDASHQHLLTETTSRGTTVYTYHSGGAEEHATATATSIDGVTRTYAYDNFGRLQRSALPSGEEEFIYSYGPGTITSQDNVGGRLQLLLNELGQTVRVIDQDNQVIDLSLDENSLLEAEVGVDGDRLQVERDSRGNITAITDAVGHTSVITYDPESDLPTSITDALGFATEFEYDALGNEIGRTYPGGEQETFAYDVQGNVVSETDSQGRQTRYFYDVHNRLTRKSFASGIVHEFFYDARDNLIETRDETGTTVFEYNSADQPTRTTYPDGSALVLTYDAFGRRTSIENENGVGIFMSYDASGRLMEQTDENGELIARYTYDATGSISLAERGDGTSLQYTRDTNGQLVRQLHLGADKLLLEQQLYTYNRAGKVAEMSVMQRADLPLTINFQPMGVEIPDGYAPDFGDVFGDRGNTLFYGWTTPNLNAVDRDDPASPDQRYDTLTQFGTNVWEIQVPNGTYGVHVVAGDPILIGSHRIDVEGVRVIDGSTTLSSLFLEETTTVQVADGRLTLTVPSGSEQTKINFIDLVRLDEGTYQYEYDDLGRLVYTEAPNGDSIAETFDAIGELVSRIVTTSSGTQVSTFSKDSFGRINAITTGVEEEFIKRQDGRPIEIIKYYGQGTNRIKVKIFLEYDEKNRLIKEKEILLEGTSKTHPQTIEYEYDAKGNLQRASGSNLVPIEFVVDPVSNLTVATKKATSGQCFNAYDAKNVLQAEVCAAGAKRYHSWDAWTNPRLVTNSTGAVQNSTSVAPNGYYFRSFVTVSTLYNSPCGGSGCMDVTGRRGSYTTIYNGSGKVDSKYRLVYSQARHQNRLRSQEARAQQLRSYCLKLRTNYAKIARYYYYYALRYQANKGSRTSLAYVRYYAAYARRYAYYYYRYCGKQRLQGTRYRGAEWQTPGQETPGISFQPQPAATNAGGLRRRVIFYRWQAAKPIGTYGSVNSTNDPESERDSPEAETTSSPTDTPSDGSGQADYSAHAARASKVIRKALGLADANIDACPTSLLGLGVATVLDSLHDPHIDVNNRVVQCAQKPPKTAQGMGVGAVDPNDILGPAGFGAERFLTKNRTLAYTIRFENLDTATAPAQEVFITQQLDHDLDFETFQLTDFGFGEKTFEVPDGSVYYDTIIDLSATLNLFVRVIADLDLQTGLLSWTFRALDPDTGDLPSDPFAGFLPPNITAPEGEGFVSYTVRPKQNLVTGDVIDAEASIVFDVNAPINTPAILNTIDDGTPTSNVDPLPVNVGAPDFTVTWSGSDDVGGSGVAAYDIYVSVNGGGFVPLLLDTTDTSLIFNGQFGTTYSFYSVATDNVGFAQPTPAGAQATTTPLPDADLNDDTLLDCTDIDALIAAIAAGSTDPAFDLNWDGNINLSDRDAWLAQAGAANLPSGNPYLLGDANLDGTVDGADFVIWNQHKFTSMARWCAGDFNADGLVDGGDFVLWNFNKFTSADDFKLAGSRIERNSWLDNSGHDTVTVATTNPMLRETSSSYFALTTLEDEEFEAEPSRFDQFFAQLDV